jgi:aspartate 1-decarboxylase
VIRTVLTSTIHRATVTQADLHYVGSITIDADLMAAVDLRDGDQVQVVDSTNGQRLVTYAITGAAGSGVIGMNGAAARLVLPGDLVTIMRFASVTDGAQLEPRLVQVDGDNRQVDDAARPSGRPLDRASAAT